MIKYFITLIGSLILSLNAHGGFKKGNGGNTLFCDGEYKTLDIYEGEKLWNLTYSSSNEQLNWKNNLNDRLSWSWEHESLEFISFLEAFESEALFINGLNLGPVDDSLHIVLPKNCQIIQTVLQQFNPLPNEKRYWINQEVWNELPPLSKSALVLHEVLYRKFQHPDSLKIRQLVGLFFSDQWENLSASQRINRLKSL